jgi:periplasmic protein CpxP/Spy
MERSFAGGVVLRQMKENTMQRSFITAIAATLWIVPGLAAPTDQKPSADSSDEPTLLLIIPKADETAQAPSTQSQDSTQSRDTRAQSDAPSAMPERESKDAGPPTAAHGPNNMTESEAKAKIEEGGFSDVSNLKKNDEGVWLGKAQREGESFEVAIDSEGNLFYRQAS